MKVPLETVISKITGLNFANADLETEDKSETIRKLRQRVEDLEQQLDEYEQRIDEYQLQLDDRDRDISKLRRMVNID
jgi:chromosome segregation ATPase